MQPSSWMLFSKILFSWKLVLLEHFYPICLVLALPINSLTSVALGTWMDDLLRKIQVTTTVSTVSTLSISVLSRCPQLLHSYLWLLVTAGGQEGPVSARSLASATLFSARHRGPELPRARPWSEEWIQPSSVIHSDCSGEADSWHVTHVGAARGTWTLLHIFQFSVDLFIYCQK